MIIGNKVSSEFGRNDRIFRKKSKKRTATDLIKALEDVENVAEKIFPAVVSVYQLRVILENLVN